MNASPEKTKGIEDKSLHDIEDILHSEFYRKTMVERKVHPKFKHLLGL